MNSGMTPINHLLWFPLRGPKPGCTPSFPTEHQQEFQGFPFPTEHQQEFQGLLSTSKNFRVSQKYFGDMFEFISQKVLGITLILKST